MTPLTDRAKAAPPGLTFLCARAGVSRPPLDAHQEQRAYTRPRSLAGAAAPRARSLPAPLQPCVQSPSEFAAAAVPAVSRGRAVSCPGDSGACWYFRGMWDQGGWWCTKARLSPPLGAASAPETAGGMHGLGRVLAAQAFPQPAAALS